MCFASLFSPSLCFQCLPLVGSCPTSGPTSFEPTLSLWPTLAFLIVFFMVVFHIFHFISNSHMSFWKVRLEMSKSWFCSLRKILSCRTGPDTRCNYLWREWVTRHCVYWLLGNSISLSCKTLSCHLNFRSAMMAPTSHWCLWGPSSIPLFPAVFR